MRIAYGFRRRNRQRFILLPEMVFLTRFAISLWCSMYFFCTKATGMEFQRDSVYRHAFFSGVETNRKLTRPALLLFSNKATDVLDCCFHCLSNKHCWSVNYEPVEESAGICEGFSWDSGQYESHLREKNGSLYSRIKTPCDSKPCMHSRICRPSAEEPLYRCDGGSRYGGERCQIDCVIFDFEHGIVGWNHTGTAFKWQPTYRDNPTARYRHQPSNHVGDWWIGTYENRSEPPIPAGSQQGDGPTGTLTSPRFTVYGNTLSFLIGGGCDINVAFVELVVSGKSVAKETGKCTETMEKRSWNVSAFKGETAWIHLADLGSAPWNHINFDDLVDSSCEESMI